MHGHIKFFNNNAVSLLSQKEVNTIQFKENLLLNISNCKFSDDIFSIYLTKTFINYTIILQESYPTCFIQYISDRENLDNHLQQKNLSTFPLSYTKLRLILYQTYLLHIASGNPILPSKQPVLSLLINILFLILINGMIL